MWRKILQIKPVVWLLVGYVFVLAVVTVWLRVSGVVSSSLSMFVIQPMAALAAAAIAFLAMKGRGDRIRHKTDKAVVVGSVLAIWFVLYFTTGLFTTYMKNTLALDLRSVLFNVYAMGVVAFCLEYVRYSVMTLAGRRNVVWFAVVVSAVFALQQMNIVGLFGVASLEEVIKLVTADVVPVLVASVLLTYLAVNAGLASMLVYRFGVLAFAILPPFIPRYDWYLLGITSMLLTLIVYVVIDRQSQGRRVSVRHTTKHSFDVMFVGFIAALALFMTGAFAYKPTAIVSNSMHPIFSRGAMVVVQKVSNPLDIQTGDIIQYQVDNIVVTHRVVATDRASDGSGKRVFITKGDNSPSKDPLVYEEQLIGVVRAAIPYVGYPTVWLREMAGPKGDGHGYDTP